MFSVKLLRVFNETEDIADRKYLILSSSDKFVVSLLPSVNSIQQRPAQGHDLPASPLINLRGQETVDESAETFMS